MNKRLLVLAVSVLACTLMMVTVTGAQERIRHVEFSIAGSAQAYVGEKETEHYISLPIRVGVFVTPNVLIEFEGIVTGWDMAWYGSTEGGYTVSLNGSYNFIATDEFMPFVLVGIGLSNGLPFANSIAFYDEDGIRPTVLNAGAGMKFLFSPMAALRIEYRMQDFSGEKTKVTWSGRSYVDKIDVTVHSMFFGVSLFF